MEAFVRMQDEAGRLREANVPANSDEGQRFAKAYWDMITEFTCGGTSLLPKLKELGQFEGTDPEWQERQSLANAYVGQALQAYFSRMGTDPFEKPKQ